jgi:hypothetical protein
MTQPQIAAVDWSARDWSARRLAIEVDSSFEDTVARYEAAAPPGAGEPVATGPA